jgi:serine/threonine protein kinase
MKIDKIFTLSRTLYLTLYEYSIAGIIHKDIKINNIIYLKDNFYFIDFGLMTTTNNIFSKNFNYNHKYTIFYAPEFILFNIINKNLDLTTFINLVLDNFDENFYKIYPKKNMTDDLIDMYNFYYEKIKKTNNIYSLFTDEDKKKLDLYSLSITLLLSYLYYYSSSKSSKIKNFINKIILPSICLNNQKRLSIDKVIELFNE